MRVLLQSSLQFQRNRPPRPQYGTLSGGVLEIGLSQSCLDGPGQQSSAGPRHRVRLGEELTHDSTTSIIVKSLAGRGSRFGSSFGQAMVKMGNIGLLTAHRAKSAKSVLKSTRELAICTTVKQAACIQDAVVEPNSKHSFVAVDMIFWQNAPTRCTILYNVHGRSSTQHKL